MIAFLHDLLGDLLRHHRRRGILLLGVGKDPHLIKTLLLHKGTERLVVRVCLSWKTNNEGRTDRHAWNTITQFLYQFFHTLTRIGAVHRTQNCIVRVLKREVNVFDYLWLGCKHLNKFIRKVLRVTVENANPCERFNLRQFPQKRWEHRFLVAIQPVVRAVLRNQDDLTHAALCKSPCLRYNVLHRTAAETAADQRYRAERTAMITPLGNFDICSIVWCRA